MSEEILRALMQLFAIIANVDKDGKPGESRSIVEAYLKQHLNSIGQEEYLHLFDEFIRTHHHGTHEQTINKKRTSSNSVKVLLICQQINEHLQQVQKIVVLIQLLEFIKNGYELSDKETDFVETVAETFNISEHEYFNIYYFIFERFADLPKKSRYLKITDGSESSAMSENLSREGLNGCVHILHIRSANLYAFKYDGTLNLFLNGNAIQNNRTYILDKGSSLRSSKTRPIYYSDIASRFINTGEKTKILLTAKEIEYRFKNSENGIKHMSFSETSGELIGIMGGSGVGKSTLLNILNGNIKPQSGNVFINNIDIYENKEKIKGLIGYVPQDDLLIEELTVYDNLFLNARLCFSGLQQTELDEKVSKILSDLDLWETKDLTVGNPLQKFISGGQRKRLNIALELIREPVILFIDEPTSGLSSMDSEMVMDLLKEQVLKGKLVIANIHQPSSDIFKLFDKLLLLDRGGYLIYYGNPVEAISYFKRHNNYVMADESECPMCGNVNPEQILHIVETKVVDEFGKLTRNRKISPREWHEIFVTEKDRVDSSIIIDEKLPSSTFKPPGNWGQFSVFIQRNILSKLTNAQYLIITFLEAPILACILGFFTRYIAGDQTDSSKYIFSLNENIPAFLFMSVVCALFFGLTISAEEIIKDRKILERERFLNLSRYSYLHSKIAVLFFISAVQMLSYVVISKWILGINGLTFSYFFILFSTACFANLLGLTLSSSLNSVVTIYITIPFILVPQLLLSGVIVKFDKLHRSISNDEYVSVAGDIMVSRWAYEALAVNQFSNNEYQQHFYNIDRTLSNITYYKDYLIPSVANEIDLPENKKNKKLISNTLQEISNVWEIPLNSEDREQCKSVLKDLKFKLNILYNNMFERKEIIKDSLIHKYGKQGFIILMENNFNEALSDELLNTKNLDRIKKNQNKYIRTMEPVYSRSTNNYGRAQLYASKKIFAGMEFDTIWFNIIIIWIASFVLYVLLLSNNLAKWIAYLSSFNKKRT